MNPAFNPQPTFDFCVEQTEFLTYMTPQGFGAIYLESVEGFTTITDVKTLASSGSRIHVKGGSEWYESTETVPELVSRFVAIKAKRHAAIVSQMMAAQTQEPTPPDGKPQVAPLFPRR